MRRIPLLLTLLRALLGPGIIWLAFVDPRPWLLGITLLVGLISDIYDGIIARRLGVATPALRRLDSQADTIFYLGVLGAAWHLYPSAIAARFPEILLVLGIDAARYVFDFLKFRREASWHMWSAKAWGVTLFAAFFVLFTIGIDDWPLTLAVRLGVVSNLEGFLISLLLPAWEADVPTFVHALRRRRGSRS